jgi:hypothetical protein
VPNDRNDRNDRNDLDYQLSVDRTEHR